MKLLIIDDSPDDRLIIKRCVRKPSRDITALEAGTASEAFEIIKDHDDIDCIFLDYMLPDMDGISALKHIYNKAQDVGPCPIVMLTGQGSETVAIEAIRYGAQDYLIKNNISTDTLDIAMAKAKEMYDLKKSHSEAKALIEHSQKMDAVGKLTGGIAHDFNNLLTITFGNARLLQDLLERDEIDADSCIKKVEKIQKATQRGADLVKRLMIFSRQRTLDPITIDVNDLIIELQDMLGRTLGDFVEIKTDLAQKTYPIYVDPGQLEHAIINISVNARDAMIDGGTLTLKTENVMISEQDAEPLEIKPGEYVKLSIADTGNGIPSDILANIFDPFFTTKDVGKGTGLGLSMVYGFVKESGGGTHVESQERQGTQFDLYFPRATNESSTSRTQEKTDTQALSGTETILVVEDEQQIRQMTVLTLQNAGFETLEAENGQEALDIIQDENTHIDLVFTDIAMPGNMNGIQMAARAEVLRPDIKLLFTSGHAEGSAPDMHLIKQYETLHKPYHLTDIIEKIRYVIDRK